MTSGSDITRLVREVYEEAIKRDPEEWVEFLDRACAGRPDVRERVEILLGIREVASSDESATPPPSTPVPTSMEGKTIGPYIVRRELGRGGMGVVFLADDTRLSRAVALKKIAELGTEFGAQLRDRLTREARVAGGLSHPSIATVYALEEFDGVLYLATEYVPGEPLRALLKGGPLAVDKVVDIALQLASALAAAHTQGIVHRDIKPENVMQTPSGVIKVLDFGLARLVDGSQSGHLTQTGAIVGTPSYIPPERWRGQTADFRGDVFALGVLTYELASGRNPFAAPSPEAAMNRILYDDPAPLSYVQPKSPPALDAIVARCLQKDPGDRWASTQELVADLEQLQSALKGQRRLGGGGGGGRGGSSTTWPSPAPARSRWWWEVHQLAVTVLYAVMLYPAWYVQRFLPRTWGTPLLLAVLAVAAAGICLRLHLWWVSRSFPAAVEAQQVISKPRLLGCDAAFSLLLVACGLLIGPEHPEFSMLFVGVAAAALVASFVIEPATARVAFGDSPGGPDFPSGPTPTA